MGNKITFEAEKGSLQGDRNIILMRLIESKLLSMDFNKGN